MATIFSNSDDEIGKLIFNAMERVGWEGVITAEAMITDTPKSSDKTDGTDEDMY